MFAGAAPRLAERLISLDLDERVKGYTAVSAISEALKILQNGVVDQQQLEQIKETKNFFTALEDGTPKVIEVVFPPPRKQSAHQVDRQPPEELI